MGRIEKQKRELIEVANKRLLGLITEQTEDTNDKIAVLFDGTSSAGKSYTAKELKAVPFYEATDHDQWVVIDSDDFGDVTQQSIKNRIQYDHEGDGKNPQAGEEFHKEMAIERKGGFGEKRGDTTVDFPKHPHNKDRKSQDGRNWYMAQEFKYGGWKKVIFDDIDNGIEKYVDTINHKLLIHSPINIMLDNIGERNKKGVQPRNPKDVLDQYLEKYESTTSKPDETIGDPTTDITKERLKTLLMDKIVDTYPDYNEEYIDGFIKDLGVTTDNTEYWIKVKDGYLLDDQLLINVGADKQTYINTIGDKLGIERSEEDSDL